MSHRRRVLNLVLKNEFTGVHSLHRLNLLSRHNNLFYPTAKEAEDTAGVLFAAADDDDHRRDFFCNGTAVRMLGDESLEKVEEVRVPPPTMSFQPSPHPRYGDSDTRWSRMDCAALSEDRTLFVDLGSRGALLHDAEARRVAAMPSFPERWWGDCFPVAGAGAGAGDDSVYFMTGDPEGDDGGDAANSLQFKAMVHRKPRARGSLYGRRWRLEELPRPPYADHAGGRRDAKVMVSYATMAGTAAAASDDVICVSTEGCGTYCFDTASRTWSKAGDWALPFAGKVEHDRELGLWLGFVRRMHYEEEGNSLYATSYLLQADVDRRSLICYAGDDDCRELMAPWGWRKADELGEPQVVGLGSGKFCVTQFFETMRPACSKCFHEDRDKGFAVLTGVEVARRGSDGREVHAGDGTEPSETELRVIIHKSKRYVFTKGNTLEFVL